MIKPFESIKKKLGERGIASVSYVERRLREVLGKLHFTANGGKVSSSADGQVHFDFSSLNAEACSFPFAVAVDASGTPGTSVITIQPAIVRTESGGAATPTFGGRALDATPPPQYSASTGFTGTRYLVMRIDYTPRFGNFAIGSYSVSHLDGLTLENAPVISVESALPSDVQPQIDWLSATSGRGTRYVTIATIVGTGGALNITQGWWGNMHIVIEGSGNLMLNIGG